MQFTPHGTRVHSLKAGLSIDCRKAWMHPGLIRLRASYVIYYSARLTRQRGRKFNDFTETERDVYQKRNRSNSRTASWTGRVREADLGQLRDRLLHPFGGRSAI